MKKSAPKNAKAPQATIEAQQNASKGKRLEDKRKQEKERSQAAKDASRAGPRADELEQNQAQEAQAPANPGPAGEDSVIDPPSPEVAREQVRAQEEINAALESRVPVPCPLSYAPLSRPSLLTTFMLGPKSPDAPNPQDHTYSYATQTDFDTGEAASYDVWGRQLPPSALQILWDQRDWELHIGGDDLLHTFVPSLVPAPTNPRVAPYLSKPHERLESLLKEHKTFFLFPTNYSNPLNTYDNSPTVHQWCEALDKSLDAVRVKHNIIAEGWVIVQAYDPYLTADQVPATQNTPVTRWLRGKITAIKVLRHTRLRRPVHANGKVVCREGDVSAQPLIAYQISGGNLLAPTHAHPPTTHDLGTLPGIAQAMRLADKGENHRSARTHLRLFVKTAELAPSGAQPVARHFYKYINKQYAPHSDGASFTTEHCYFPFTDAEIWTPRGGGGGGYSKVDYILPAPLADTLMRLITTQHSFTKGTIYAMPLEDISSPASYYLQPTRASLAEFKGDWSPSEVLATFLGHVPGGVANVDLLGSAVRTATSIIVRVNIDRVPTLEGLSREQSISRQLFLQGGLLMYRASDASLVRHIGGQLAWKTPAPANHQEHSVIPKFPPAASTATGLHLCHVASHADILETDVKETISLLGKWAHFGRITSGRPGENWWRVEFIAKESLALAFGFELEGIRLYPDGPEEVLAATKNSLLIQDATVRAEDRALVAVITAGESLGSRLMLSDLREKEQQLIQKVQGLDINDWADSVAKDPAAPSQDLVDASPERADLEQRQEEDAAQLPQPESTSSGQSVTNALTLLKGVPAPQRSLELTEALQRPISTAPPDGLYLIKDFIDRGMETKLLNWARRQQYEKVGDRQISQFGYSFDHSVGIAATPPTAIPNMISELFPKVRDHSMGPDPDAIMVARYQAPYDLNLHKDRNVFGGHVSVLSIAGGCTMIFVDHKGNLHPVYLEPRSLLIMRSSARATWKHGIPYGDTDLVQRGSGVEQVPRSPRFMVSFRYLTTEARADHASRCATNP